MHKAHHRYEVITTTRLFKASKFVSSLNYYRWVSTTKKGIMTTEFNNSNIKALRQHKFKYSTSQLHVCYS